MKIVSWNVNGIRAIMKKNFLEFLEKEDPDILLLQEIKISEDKLDNEDFNFFQYEAFWHPAQRAGYSGTAILFKKDLKVLDKQNGLGIKNIDIEGRVQVLELKNFYLLNAYFPNSNPELSRLPYKINFNQEILKYLKKLDKVKPVIIGGDFNVAHEEIDLARPKENERSPGFTKEERDSFSKFVKSGFIDSFRFFYPDQIKYSWWSFRTAARSRNVGWRIDYFCCSQRVVTKIKKADILTEVLGSDHAPVTINL